MRPEGIHENMEVHSVNAIFAVLLAATALLPACRHVPGSGGAASQAGEVGSPAWFADVDRKLGVSDGQGHGPDAGSQEWCDAAHFKLHGQRASQPVPCDAAWLQELDAALADRKRH